jgi:replicative DNA helicase
LRFNIPSIDKEMHHGLLPGQVVVVIAKSNAGKTLATLNIFQRMALARPDIKILYISLEQTRNEWFERAHRIQNFYYPNSTVLDTVKFWQDKLMLVDKNRLTEEELEVCLDQYEFETGSLPDIVAVDYLGYYSRSFPGEEYARVTSAIMGLKGIAKSRQIVAFVPHQVNRTGNYGQAIQADQGKSSGAIEETADMLISLWNPDQQLDVHKEDQKKEVNMQILKSRDGGVGSLIQLQFAPLTLAMVPKEDTAYYEKAVRERQYWLAGFDWKRAVYAHATGDESINFTKE